MNSENQEVIYCADDDEYRVYCEVCDKLCIKRFYKNHLKSQTHINQIIISNNSTQLKMELLCPVCDRSIVGNESEYHEYMATMQER